KPFFCPGPLSRLYLQATCVPEEAMPSIRRFVSILVLALITAGSLHAADGSLESRLQVLEDKEAIRNLLLDYGRHLDNRNWEAFAELFAEDGGTWDGGMGVARGYEQIRNMMINSIGSDNVGTGGTGLSNLHLLGNETISVDGDSATAHSKWVFVM